MLQHFGGDETWEPKHFDMVGHGTNARGRGYTTLVWKESQAEYYRLACQALHSEEFKNHAYRLVWQLHTEGLSADEIMQTFQKGSNLLNGTTRKTRHLIQKMAKDFGIKPFKPKKDENEV